MFPNSRTRTAVRGQRTFLFLSSHISVVLRRALGIAVKCQTRGAVRRDGGPQLFILVQRSHQLAVLDAVLLAISLSRALPAVPRMLRSAELRGI